MTIAIARMYAVTTQPWCSTPLSSPTIVGIAVPTIDWSSDDMNMPAMSAPKMSQTVRGVRTISGLSVASAAGAAMAMRETSFYRCVRATVSTSGDVVVRRVGGAGSVGDDRPQLGDHRGEVVPIGYIGRRGLGA